mgnify:FL=1
MSRAIVTGGAGFIGSNLVDSILPLYDEVIVIDNESSDANEQFYWNNKCTNYKFDICDYKSIRPLFNDVEVVFHLAAEARIQPAVKNPILATKTNVVGTCTVLQCAREANVKRVIYSSTSSGYGLKNDVPLNEEMPDDCLNPYSVTKVSGEKLCKMYTDLFGLETVTFRYFNVYGERQPIKGQYAPVIGIFIRQRDSGESMTIVGDGKQRRDFTHVSDVVTANVLASVLENKEAVGKVLNIGTGINHSILEIAKLIGDNYTFIESRLGEAQETLANTDRAKEMLGWAPSVKLEDWLKENS